MKSIKEILILHGKWLRGEKGGEFANLSDMNLAGADLRYANLKNAYLDGANLEGANLRGANLEDAYLMGTNFKKANLECANLSYAGMEDANLEGANLCNAHFYLTNLTGVNIKGAIFQFADFYGTVFPEGMWQVTVHKDYDKEVTWDSVNDYVIFGNWQDGKGNHLDSFKDYVEIVYKGFGKSSYKELKDAIKFFEFKR